MNYNVHHRLHTSITYMYKTTSKKHFEKQKRLRTVISKLNACMFRCDAEHYNIPAMEPKVIQTYSRNAIMLCVTPNLLNNFALNNL